MDNIEKVLRDYKATLMWKRNSWSGLVGNTKDVHARQRLESRISKIEVTIREVDAAINDRLRELIENERVLLNHCGEPS